MSKTSQHNSVAPQDNHFQRRKTSDCILPRFSSFDDLIVHDALLNIGHYIWVTYPPDAKYLLGPEKFGTVSVVLCHLSRQSFDRCICYDREVYPLNPLRVKNIIYLKNKRLYTDRNNVGSSNTHKHRYRMGVIYNAFEPKVVTWMVSNNVMQLSDTTGMHTGVRCRGNTAKKGWPIKPGFSRARN